MMPFVSFHIPGAKDSDDDKTIIGFYKKKKNLGSITEC